MPAEPSETQTVTGLVDQLTDALKRVSVRAHQKLPAPQVFTITEGKSFKEFIKHFERYCSSEISDSPDDWQDLLGKYLKGEMKEMYHNIRKGEKTYAGLKENLAEWYQVRKKYVVVDYKTEFKQAKMEAGESMWGYTVRLQALAKRAYGDKYQKALMKKFINTAPESFTNIITMYSFAKYGTAGTSIKDLEWKTIKELASLQKQKKEEFLPKKTGYKTQTKYSDDSSTEDSDEENSKYVGAAALTQETRDAGIQTDEPRGNTMALAKRTSDQTNLGHCFRCGNTGHFIAACPMSPPSCWNCGDPSHLFRNCPTRYERGRGQYHRGPNQSRNMVRRTRSLVERGESPFIHQTTRGTAHTSSGGGYTPNLPEVPAPTQSYSYRSTGFNNRNNGRSRGVNHSRGRGQFSSGNEFTL